MMKGFNYKKSKGSLLYAIINHNNAKNWISSKDCFQNHYLRVGQLASQLTAIKEPFVLRG